ncbi:hypothetical protein Salat_2952400 [Sesamum alatum]|uniref:WRC domain-containing protein n=1 Tax=Sesamum alatum TaxID=300844 RepID=A0AAE1XKE0_9LAMI|nr:hypothetical protein Salat_2952400 [Sesamum alatum]
MRIRKRLPLSSIPTSPFSDLQLHRSEAAAPPDQPSDPPQQPSAQSMPTRNRNTRWASQRNDETQEKMKQKWQELFGDDEKWRLEEEKKSSNNDIRKIVSICGGDANKIQPPPLSSSSAHHDQDKSWCEGDCKLVPLKKRKGSFERNPKEEITVVISAKMKSKTNKKCGDHIVQVDQLEAVMKEENGISSSASGGGGPKKSKRENVIMEGSRCSRVNGRGWRCCQPTLVGYSLCEHHLGKGRLRSMANVRRRVDAGGSSATPLPSSGGDCSHDQQQAALPPPPMVTKKRTKVGVVKARSMSSLLSQI